ncbi:MAG TPA: LutB/LldF family L-lactate oxidation iron-sulfur protein [Thermoanaerobaculia bacterium]|jgi:L-lactate dehydrogenase complex protein LldF|nr:LutB/LldF family L-lactate oxidation iron-sulfur protein [Thermoanaerobaculia bacterium]
MTAPAAPPDFRAGAAAALADPKLRANFRRAMDGLMAKRAALFADPAEWRSLRALGAAIRARSLARLPELLERLEERLRANGIQVHWAETTAEANAAVLAILRARGATRVVKGKSMVSEEMHLNAFLDAHGVESLESDLGEYVVQLDGEMPSHIIMPCIHKDGRQIARLFGEKIRGARYTEDVDELTAMARRVLRAKFQEADAGISGVNIAVAETGTLVLIENEGNGRMSTHVPPVHVALMGIEKVVERLEDVPPLLALLCRSATGQTITTYTNLISGPRAAGELDGPREVHLVILDNGRSRIFADPELRATLRCIRCGACMNHCPVYTRVGGHAYQAVYPGPIGKILIPQTEGLKLRRELPQASSLCGACVEVCPVEIPITELLLRLRREAAHPDPGSPVLQAGEARAPVEDRTWAAWRRVFASPRVYRLVSRLATRLRWLPPPRLGPLRAWTGARSAPRPARRTLHELARRDGVPDA